MVRDVIDRRKQCLGDELNTRDEPPINKRRNNKETGGNIADEIPSDIQFTAVQSDDELKTLDGGSNQRTLATLTETFTSASDDFVSSFDVHEGLDIQRKLSVTTEEPVNITTKSSRPRPRSRWPTNFYRAVQYGDTSQRPVPPRIFSSCSTDSWDEEQNDGTAARHVSLLDIVDGRDDEDDADEGHDGDDERDAAPGSMDEMRRMTMQFQLSARECLVSAPVVKQHGFRGSVPKIGGGPLSRLRKKKAPKDAFEVSTNGTLPSINTSSSSIPRSARNAGNRSAESRQMRHLNGTRRVEMESKPEESMTEMKGIFSSLRELVYCLPGSGGG